MNWIVIEFRWRLGPSDLVPIYGVCALNYERRCIRNITQDVKFKGGVGIFSNHLVLVLSPTFHGR